jgi:uncharacterized protein
MADGRALPIPTPETQHYWKGAQEGKLLLQRCESCAKAYFPPRPFCPTCSSQDVTVVQASGRASLYSYAIQHRAAPGFTAPYAIAVVTLEEGPRMMTNIIDCPQTPEALQLDMPLKVTFREINETVSLPVFRPAGANRDA